MKQQLRRHFRSLRASLSQERRDIAATLACHRFLKTGSRIASFCPIHHEIDLSLLNSELARLGALLLPRVDGDTLCFIDATSNRETVLTESDLLLVPGLAFDANHRRLGYGKGHFDRFLASHPHVHSIGIGFLEQFSEELLPQDPWDLPVRELQLF